MSENERRDELAVAWLATGLQVASASETPTWQVLLPDGHRSSTKGDFIVDQEGAELVLSLFKERGNPLVIDNDHASLGGAYARPDGEVPAYGWIEALRYTPGEGIEGQVEWTQRGKERVEKREYRFFSPVFAVRLDDRRVVAIKSVALTNEPAIDRMTEIAASAGVNNWLEEMEVMIMADEVAKLEGGGGEVGGGGGTPTEVKEELKKELKKELDFKGKLRAKLGLPEDASDEAILEAVGKLKEAPPADTTKAGGESAESAEVAASVRKVFGLAASADVSTIVAAAEAAHAHVGYVPASQHNAVVQRVGALEQASAKREAEELVAACLGEGKLNAADKQQMAWANSTAAKDPEGFKVIMASAPVVIPQGRTTPAAGGGGGTGSRTAVIAASTSEYRGNTDVQKMTSVKAFVNESLREAKREPLSDKEAAELVVG